MVFIQIVSAMEVASDTGLSPADAVANTQNLNATICNDYCKQAVKRLDTTLFNWLETSGIYEMYKSRPHCIETRLTMDPVPTIETEARPFKMSNSHACLNKIEIIYVGSAIVMVMLCILLAYRLRHALDFFDLSKTMFARTKKPKTPIISVAVAGPTDPIEESVSDGIAINETEKTGDV